MLKLSIGFHNTITKYPTAFRNLIDSLVDVEVYIITDNPKKGQIVRALQDQQFAVPEDRILIADREAHGAKCVAKVVTENNIDFHIDGNPEYVDNTKCINLWIWPNNNYPAVTLHFKNLDGK
jgi:hypothetical protein